ncbi:metal ABC transporter permease [uncultured Clostridium sp.]|uniref:metal ABC transporter permease n=1 Tax=uncultured Clostridium sp. TaxID=59620 RepID=UPI002621CEC0|nr:metal ABC transporter permease [uncultured Clostridium sp.]
MFQIEFMRHAFMAGIIISVLCPCIGLFLVLKRYSMIGDTLSHSSFAGVAIGLTAGLNPLLTAFIFTTLCAVVIEVLRTYFKKYSELVMSIILTLSLGIAIVLVSSGKTSAKVDSYLFGSILTVSQGDLIIIGLVAIACFIGIFLIYDKLVYTTFDEEGAKVSGINTKLINYIFTIMVGATISVSIRVMGILVISSIIVLPVATAMQFKQGFTKTLFMSMFVGFIDIVIGLFGSYYYDSAPGGTIALTSVAILVIALIINRKKL